MIYILFWCFWIMMGLQAIAPYISSRSFEGWTLSCRILILIFFILIGPLIAICNIVNVIIAFFCKDDDG